MTETTIETIATPQTEEALDAIAVSPLPSVGNGHETLTATSDISPTPLLRGQQRPSPIGPPIPNHPLAPLAGKYADEPLWDDFQEAIRKYRQRMNEQEQEDEAA